jgi:glycosyltransferase involved in cell wall biosynthesis
VRYQIPETLNNIMAETKPVILTFIRHYLPGFKYGGPSRSVFNMVQHLGGEYEFKIVTYDRDWGDTKPYDGVMPNQWQYSNGAMVYYFSPESCTLKGISNLVTNVHHDVLYLNSFFDQAFTVRLLLARRMGYLPTKPIVVAPRGEFEEGSISLKHKKKCVYIRLARFFGLYSKVIWQASSQLEALDIRKHMKSDCNVIYVALNLPTILIPSTSNTLCTRSTTDSAGFRAVFLSRISREKNLDYALRVLSRVVAKVDFDIYGPIEDATYWKECEVLIRELPPNVSVTYLGSVKHSQVADVFSQYDLFFFPTSGENYGHVIVEALTAGTPVLISDRTPWSSLEVDGLGWVRDLAQMDSFVKTIENYAGLSSGERSRKRNLIKENMVRILRDTTALEANRMLFRAALSC